VSGELPDPAVLAHVLGEHRRAFQRLVGRWGIAGELFRIVVDPYSGKRGTDGRIFRLGLATALLAELVLAGWADCRDLHQAHADADEPEQVAVGAAILVPAEAAAHLADRALHDTAAQVAASPVRGARYWLRQLATKPYEPGLVGRLPYWVEELVGCRLETAGLVRRDIYQPRLRRTPVTVMVGIDGHRVGALHAMARIPRAMADGKPLDDEDVVLGALVSRMGLSGRVRRESTYRTVSVEPYLSGLPAPLRLLIAHAHAAFGQAATDVR
jgi:Golgi phosphoprotein 3 GPP34